MGFFTAAVGSAIGSFVGKASGSLASSYIDYMSNRSLNKKAIQQQLAAELEGAETIAKNSPSWNVEGLRSAGINPILAVNGGNLSDVSIPSVSGSSAPSSQGFGNPVVDALTAQQLYKQNELLQAQTEGQDAQNTRALVDTYNHLLTQGLGGSTGAIASGVNAWQHEELLLALRRKIAKKLGIPDASVTTAKTASRVDDNAHNNDDGSVTVGSGTEKRTYYFKKGEHTPYKVLDYRGELDNDYLRRLRQGR